ncbi:hypothetical protein D3C83_170160 [compost metagenome]
MTERDFSSAAAAFALLPDAIAFLTSLIALRAAVRRLMFRSRRLSACRARLRADAMFAIASIRLRKGAKF